MTQWCVTLPLKDRQSEDVRNRVLRHVCPEEKETCAPRELRRTDTFSFELVTASPMNPRRSRKEVSARSTQVRDTVRKKKNDAHPIEGISLFRLSNPSLCNSPFTFAFNNPLNLKYSADKAEYRSNDSAKTCGTLEETGTGFEASRVGRESRYDMSG